MKNANFVILEIRNMNILKYLHTYGDSLFLPKIFYKFFIKEVYILAIYLSTHNLAEDEMHSARELHLAARYAICDISIPNISHKATPPRTVILNIIYVPSRTKKERERKRDRLNLSSCVCACIKNACSNRVTARRTKRHEYGRGGLESENNIDPLFRPANKYHKYRPAELSGRSCTLQHRTSRFRSRIRLFSVHWRTWVCTTTVRGIGFAPRWPFVHMNKEVRIAYNAVREIPAIILQPDNILFFHVY